MAFPFVEGVGSHIMPASKCNHPITSLSRAICRGIYTYPRGFTVNTLYVDFITVQIKRFLHRWSTLRSTSSLSSLDSTGRFGEGEPYPWWFTLTIAACILQPRKYEPRHNPPSPCPSLIRFSRWSSVDTMVMLS